LMTLLMSGVAVFAYTQRTQAVRSARVAEEQRALAEEQRNIAEERAHAATKSEATANEERAKAEEQSRRADEQKDIAIKASQRADVERAKAVAASERADEEAEVARVQAHEANIARADAVKQKGYADEQRTLAEKQRKRADGLARVSFSRELAAAASNKLNSDPELSVLLALHGLKGTMAGEAGGNDPATPASETKEGGASGEQTVTKEAEDALHQAVQASRVRRTLGHEAAANRVAFSPDGRHAATASAEGSVKLWDAVAGDELLTIAASGSDIQGLTFSPDGKLLAASRDGGTISVWETDSGNEVHSITEGLGAIKTIAFSPDSKWLAVAANKRQGHSSRFSPFLLNSATGEAAALPYANNQPRQDTTLTFTDDGQTLTMGSCLIKGSNRCTAFEVVSWDVKTQQAKETRPVLVSALPASSAVDAAHADPPCILTSQARSASSAVDAAFSAQTMRVAAIYQTGQTKLFDAATGKEIRTFNEKIRDNVGWLVAISPRGGYVTAYGDDGTVKMWDAEDGTLLVDQIPTTKSTSERETSKREESVSEDEGPRNSAGVTAKALFNGDGTRLATFAAWDNTVHVWDTQTGEEMATLTGHTGGVYRVAFSPDNTHLLTASADETVKVWDIAPSRELLTIKGDWSEIIGLAYSPDGKSLAGAGDDGKARVWSVADGHEEHVLTAGEGRVLGVAYSRDGRFMATAHRDGVARLWDATSGKFLRNLNAPPERSYAEMWDVAFSRDGERVVMGSSSGKVIVSATATGKELFELHDADMYDEKEKAAAAAEKREAPAHAESVYRVAFSPDDKLIATASGDTTVKLWNAAGGKHLSTLTGHADEVWDVAFSSDSKRLATASHDRTAQIWDITKTTEGSLTPSVVLTLSGHTRWLWCVAFSPDDKRIATGSSDNTTKLWDAVTGEELLTLTGHTKAVNRIAFRSPDGKHLATSSEDGTVREYTLDIEELKQLARKRVSRETFRQTERVKYLHEKPQAN
jgi:WD40 repeat protein